MRAAWPALAFVFGLLSAGSIGYLVGQHTAGQPVVTVQPAAVTQPLTSAPTVATWRGLVVQAEHRCAPYDADDYPYSQAVEAQIVAKQGGRIYGPYSGRWFGSTGETDIEHIVARSEAHDSGLCAADAAKRRAFAGDVRNLTLASPEVNRYQKSANDAAAWLPQLNQCWFAQRVVEVRQAYQLTIDQAEADALDRVLTGCTSTAMIVTAPPAAATPPPAVTAPSPTQAPSPVVTAPPATTTPPPATSGNALDLYDDNGNGRITCAEARAHGIAPVHRGHPAYEFMRDGDGDGVVCE